MSRHKTYIERKRVNNLLVVHQLTCERKGYSYMKYIGFTPYTVLERFRLRTQTGSIAGHLQ